MIAQKACGTPQQIRILIEASKFAYVSVEISIYHERASRAMPLVEASAPKRMHQEK